MALSDIAIKFFFQFYCVPYLYLVLISIILCANLFYFIFLKNIFHNLLLNATELSKDLGVIRFLNRTEFSEGGKDDQKALQKFLKHFLNKVLGLGESANA